MTLKKLVFASGNQHKLDEIKKLLILPDISIVSMREIGFEGEIEETGTTLEENAAIKARFIHDKFGINCFADDTGLEVNALNGRPGVYSARYAGEGCSFEDNVNKMLFELKGSENRHAQFKTVFHVILDEEEFQIKGEVEGQILTKPQGEGGFGYDPIFQPLGFSKTFAEMSVLEKNQISHRAIATQKLIEFLQKTMVS